MHRFLKNYRERHLHPGNLAIHLIALPVTFAVLAFGYSDQAPAFLRSTVIALDRTLGYPIAALLGTVGPR